METKWDKFIQGDLIANIMSILLIGVYVIVGYFIIDGLAKFFAISGLLHNI